MSGVLKRAGRGPMTKKELGLKKNCSLLVDQGKVVWLGPAARLPRELRRQIKKDVAVRENLFPGFIDCHTHSVFAGDRRGEFELRNTGVSYQEIARQGGGIQSTVKATRKASEATLAHLLLNRLNRFAAQGVTTVEVKSGYGLSVPQELKMLRAIKNVKHPVRRVSTFLGAHGLGPEHSSNESYLESLKKALPQIAKLSLADRVDIFVEKGYFTVEQARDYLSEAKRLGFDVMIHADQLSRTGASRLCVDMGAVSTDHAICVNKKDIALLSQSEVTSVLLPAADFYIHCPYPPARQLIDQGGRVALATDFNPGSSPTQNIQFVGLLARLKMNMSLPEVYSALTVGAAHALSLQSCKGALVPKYDADFFTCSQSWDELFYGLGSPQIKSVYIAGQRLAKKYLLQG